MKRSNLEVGLDHSGNREGLRLTIIGEPLLATRLWIAVRFYRDQLKRIWPQLKSNPILFFGYQSKQLLQHILGILRRPYLSFAFISALSIVTAVTLGILLLEHRSNGVNDREDSVEDFDRVTMIDFQAANSADSGLGLGGQGTFGFNKAKGEGSAPTSWRAQGGGSGGMRNPIPQSQGRLPVPSFMPAPVPTARRVDLPQALPEGGIDLDPALWHRVAFDSYGDPRSKQTQPSNGPGDEGGVGTNRGVGIGEGEGDGFGPGRKGNMGGDSRSQGSGGIGGSSGKATNDDSDRVYKSSEVATRARVISKSEPQYTEEARRGQITGTVILSVVFSSAGAVTNIRALQPLCCGLTEKAIAAARQIRFVPATRNGHPVSMYMQLEYNFNLY